MKLRAWCCLGLLACGGSGTPTQTPTEVARPVVADDAPPPPRADGRLPALARPLRYDLALDLDPAKREFSGVMTIELEIPKPTRHVVVNAEDFLIEAATLGGQDAKTVARAGELVVSVPAPVSGTASLVLRYRRAYSQGLEGLYSVKGAVYSDFEPVDARKAFPCFDDPAYKAPYTIHVAVPKGQLAFSNGKERARTDRGAQTVFDFETTRPLPAYLVAIAAGKLAVLEGEKAAGSWPVRLIARPEALSAARAQPALHVAASTLALLEQWFGVDYPYGKLDLVAVPDFGAGAMENAGLVTFREELLLVDPEQDSRRQRRSMETVIVHELAHQWFGDLVTTAWWDDIWLNEGFASFMEAEILDQWNPDSGSVLDRYLDAQRAMELDALPSARRVRQPVHSASDAREAFDPITYDKGAMVLQMAQSWLGKPAFREAVSRYVKKHADGNATAADLFAELDAAGSLATGTISAALSAYLDRPGVPWLGESVRGAWTPRGVPADPSREWPLVFCHAPRLCAPLAAGKPSDAFSFASSYVRGAPALGANESAADKLARQWNTWAELRGGRGDAAAAFTAWQKESVALVKSATSRHALESLSWQSGWLMPALIGTPREKTFAASMRKELLPLWKKPTGISADDRAAQRAALAMLLAGHVRDAGVQRELRATLDKVLAEQLVSADDKALAYRFGAANGDAALWDKLHERWSKATAAAERTLLLQTLLSFDDDAQLTRTLDLLLAGKLPQQDLRYVIGVLIARPTKVAMLNAWTQKNWTKLTETLSLPVLTRFAAVFGALCDTRAIDESKGFYGKNVGAIEGAKRGVELAEQGARVCAALATALR